MFRDLAFLLVIGILSLNVRLLHKRVTRLEKSLPPNKQ